MANSDCFAFGGSRCRVLTSMICDKRKCGFYKTKEQFRADLEKYPPIDYKSIYENRHNV